MTQVLPAPDAADAEVRSAITVMFNRPVVPLTSLADQASLPNPLVLDPPASGKGEWLNTSIYIFRPDTPLAGGQTYTGRVAAGLQDTTGGLLKDDFVWHFGTQAPAVVSSIPAFNATDFLLTDPISITFNQPMDHASVQSAFHLQPSGGGADIAGQIKWSADDLTMGFYPSQNLPLAAKLQATLDAAAKTAGGATLGAAYTVLFDTVKHPAIVSTSPGDGDQSADSRSGFRIVFASPMDVSTLETNIDIQPKPTQVYTSWSDSDLSFFLGWDLKPSTDYVVTLGAGMKDPYGNAIPQGQTVKFHTAALPPEIFFNSQGAVGTYNAYSDTVLYVTSLNLDQAIFNLYKLPLDQFAALTGPPSPAFRARADPLHHRRASPARGQERADQRARHAARSALGVARLRPAARGRVRDRGRHRAGRRDREHPQRAQPRTGARCRAGRVSLSPYRALVRRGEPRLLERAPEVAPAADVAVGRVVRCHVIPAGDRAGRERARDETALPLAREHLGPQRGEIPASVGDRAELGERRAALGAGSEVLALVWIPLEVVQEVGSPGQRISLCEPCRTITWGCTTPSARYSARTGSAGGSPSPARKPVRSRPSSGAAGPASGQPPARPTSVGPTSSSETGVLTLRGAIAGGWCTISGTRAEPSKNDILYQRPRSPSMSPWSDVTTTIVSSAMPTSSSVSSIEATCSSTRLIAAE